MYLEFTLLIPVLPLVVTQLRGDCSLNVNFVNDPYCAGSTVTLNRTNLSDCTLNGSQSKALATQIPIPPSPSGVQEWSPLDFDKLLAVTLVNPAKLMIAGVNSSKLF